MNYFLPLLKTFKSDLRKNNLYQNIIFLTLLLMPVAFAAGPAVMEVLIFFCCASFLLLVMIKKVSFSIEKEIKIFLICYFGILCLISFFAFNSTYSFLSSISTLRFFILILASIYLLKTFKQSLKYIYYAYLFIYLFAVLDGYVQFFLGKDLFFISPVSENIISGFYGEEKRLGSFLVRLLPILLGISIHFHRSEKNPLISLLIIAITFPLVVFTSERTALLFLFITGLFTTLYFFKEIARNIKTYSIIFLSIIVTFLLIYNFNINNFSHKLINTSEQITDNYRGYKFWSMQHQAFAETSIEIFKKNKLFGTGVKSYRVSCKQIPELKIKYDTNNCSTHPHNIFFQILAETGMLGISFYLVILFILTTKLFGFLFIKRKRVSSVFFLLSFSFFFNPLFPSGNFFNNWYMCIGIFPLIFYFYETENFIKKIKL